MKRNSYSFGLLILFVIYGCQPAPVNNYIEPTAGTWKPWVIPANDSFLLPPPDKNVLQKDLSEIAAAQKNIDSTMRAQIHFWNSGPPAYRWQSIADDFIDTTQNYLRVYALVNVAIYDATLAAWKNKYAHNITRPASQEIKYEVLAPQTPSFPCEHSVTAAAAATMLGYLYPDKADSILEVARQVGRSRVAAGVQYPSDVKAGFELGVRVANYIIEKRAKKDGWDKPWPGKIPTEKGYWKGKPLKADIPNVKPWVLSSTNQFRSVTPPDVKIDMEELKAFKRTHASNYRAYRWEFEWPWASVLEHKIMEYGLSNNAPRTARIYALMSISDHENQIANIESKYVYFRIRPDQVDPTYKTVFRTPPSPAYPAGHATVAASQAEMLSYLFPYDAKEFHALAQEEILSRFEGGVHYRTDNEAGAKLGKEVALEVIKRAKQDGADKK
jgi:membrane-associated phospholipid phosphatase